MSNFTITIEAPALVGAINNLAEALRNATTKEQTLAQAQTPTPVFSQGGPVQVQAPATPPTTYIAPQPQAVAPTGQQPVPVPATSAPVVPTATPVPTTPAPAYTLDQLAQAAATLRDAGKLPQLQALLQSFSIRSMQELPAERYGEFATKLREMGAKI